MTAEKFIVKLTKRQIDAIDFALERTLGSPITTWTKRDVEVAERALSTIRQAQTRWLDKEATR